MQSSALTSTRPSHHRAVQNPTRATAGPVGSRARGHVFVCQGCHDEVPQTGGLNHRDLFPHSLEAGSWKSVRQQG